MQEVIKSIPEQIKEALDGRTQRKVALDVKIPESEFSRKMRLNTFTEEELTRIEERLNFTIKRTEVTNEQQQSQ